VQTSLYINKKCFFIQHTIRTIFHEYSLIYFYTTYYYNISLLYFHTTYYYNISLLYFYTTYYYNISLLYFYTTYYYNNISRILTYTTLIQSCWVRSKYSLIQKYLITFFKLHLFILPVTCVNRLLQLTPITDVQTSLYGYL